MKKFLIIVLIVLLTFLSSCDSELKIEKQFTGEYITKKYEFENATKITIKDITLYDGVESSKPKVYFHTNIEKFIEIYGQEDLINKLTVNYLNSLITISGSVLEKYTTDELKIDIYGYTFEEINISYVDCTLQNVISTQKLTLNISSNSTLIADFDMESDYVKIICSGASSFSGKSIDTTDFISELSGKSSYSSKLYTVNMNVDFSGESTAQISEGTCDNATLELSGESNLSARKFSITNAYLNFSGVSTAEISVSNQVNGEMSGGSICDVIGDPMVSVSTSGDSRVNIYDK